MASIPSALLWTQYLEELIDWERFAIFLPQIKQHHVDKIKKDNLGVDNSKLALWTVWIKIYPQANWSDVLEALKKVREYKLADDIEKRLVDDLTATSTTNEQRGI